MRKVNSLEYLSFHKCSDSSLRAISGNPFVVRGSADGNQPQLTLIRSKFVSGGSGKKAKQVSQASDHKDPGARLLAWLNANQGMLTAIGLVVSACFFVGGWYMKSGLKEGLREYVDTSLKEVLAPIREDLRRTREDIIKLQADLANLHGRLGGIADIVYRERASALGVKEPQILPVKLAKSSEVRLIDKEKFYDFTLMLEDVG